MFIQEVQEPDRSSQRTDDTPGCVPGLRLGNQAGINQLLGALALTAATSPWALPWKPQQASPWGSPRRPMLSAHTACLDMTRVRSPAFLGSHHRGHVCREHQESRDPKGSPQPGYLTQNGCRAHLSPNNGHAKPSLQRCSLRAVCWGVGWFVLWQSP